MRSCEPGRQENSYSWELWNLQALWPDAGPDDLDKMKERRNRILAREREALAGLWSGDRRCLTPGHSFLEANPELLSGLIVSSHLGPYRLLPEPFLDRGISPVVLVNGKALERFRPQTDILIRTLGLKTKVDWASLSDKGFARKIVHALRDGRPVIAYLDGNAGLDGYSGVRNQGQSFFLPGREIRIRTGLARLVSRLGCPVHPVNVFWNAQGKPLWQKGPTWVFDQKADPRDIATTMYQWCFQEIMKRPQQWSFWEMIKESSACFSSARLDEPGIPKGLRDDFQMAWWSCLDRSPQTVRLTLEREVEVWAGDVLVDLTDDRFFPAEGMTDSDLDILRESTPSLAELMELHGRSWVQYHGLRLCLLGLVRMGGAPSKL